MTLSQYTASIKNKKIAVIGMGVSNTPLIRRLLRDGCSVTARDASPREKLGALADVEDEVFDVDDDEDDDMVDVECPNCHEQVCFDASILYDDDLIEVTCPNCGAVVFVNDEEDDEELEEDEEEE